MELFTLENTISDIKYRFQNPLKRSDRTCTLKFIREYDERTSNLANFSSISLSYLFIFVITRRHKLYFRSFTLSTESFDTGQKKTKTKNLKKSSYIKNIGRHKFNIFRSIEHVIAYLLDCNWLQETEPRRSQTKALLWNAFASDPSMRAIPFL